MKKSRIVIANWKMNLGLKESDALAKKLAKKFTGWKKGTVAVCPDFVALPSVGKLIKGTPIKLGAQSVFWEERGAYTGEVPAGTLLETGCNYVIIGHSERRKYSLENYEMINKKLKAVLNVEKLTPIVCIGENWDERKTDRVDFVLINQLQQALCGLDLLPNQPIIIAYEPIWAIGSGNAMEAGEAEYSHKIIRLALNNMFGMKTVETNFRIIYGGSISSQNAKEFAKIDYLDGLLVGGASLDADEFYRVAELIIN